MFKNPLKHQQGGQINQEQEAENQLISAISQTLGAQPEQVKARLDEIKANPQETQALQQALQLMQQDKNAGFKAVLNLFAKSSYKQGGKIQAFICKHAKGGIAGCGCVKKGAEGITMDNPEGYTWGQYNKNDFLNSGPDHTGWTQVRTPDGRIGYARNYRRRFLGIPSRNLDQILVTPDLEDGKYRSVGRGLNGFFGNGQVDTVYRFRNPEDDTKNRRAVVDSALEGVAPQKKQRGGYLIPDMSYVSLGEIPGYTQDLGAATITPLIGERAMVDGNDVFIPNRQIAGALVWGNDPNEIGILEPGAGYTPEGKVYSPTQINTRKNKMRDIAHVQNERDLIKSEQEGGELSRRQAFKLAKENMGYKPGSGQTAFAYANAKDALRREGVRGSALRQQARQMIAGRNYSDTAIPSSMPLLTQNFVAYQNNPTNLVGNRPSDAISGLNKMSFNNAFRTALNNGKTVFVWKGKPYTTELAQTTPVQNKTTLDINSLPEDVRNNLTGNVTVEIPEIEEPNLPNEYLALQPNDFEKELYRQRLNSLFRRNSFTLPSSGLVYKNGGVVKGQKGIGHKEQKMFDSVTNKITSKTQNISPVTGMRYEQPLVPEYPEIDVALMAVQPGTIIEKLIAPGAYKGMIQALHEGDTESLLHGLMPASKIKYIPEGAQSPYKWIPSKEYIRDAAERGTDVDDFLFALKRNPKLGTNPKEMYGKFGNASTKKIRLNPTAEEVENTVYDIFERYGMK